MKHYLISSDDSTIWEGEFDREIIRANIVQHLAKCPDDELTHEKQSKCKKTVGNDILGFFKNNPKTGKPCRIITKGQRDFYKPIS